MKFEDLKKCLKENDLMKNQNVIDICNSFSSRHNSIKYKIEGNSAIYEDGTIIKFILNDDNEIEYYIINNQGDMSEVYPIYDYKLLDLTESDIDFSNMTPEEIDEYYSDEYYKKTQETTDLEEKFENACYTAASQWMSGVNEETDEEFIKTMIVPVAKRAYNSPDKTDEDYFNQIVFELQNGRGIKFDFNK